MNNNKQELVNIALDVYLEQFSVFDEFKFKKDVNNFFSIKKMLKKFISTSELKEAVLLNKLVIAINTFGIHKSDDMMKCVLTEEEYRVAQNFLLFLGVYIPANRVIFNDIKIDDLMKRTSIHQIIIEKLEKMEN